MLRELSHLYTVTQQFYESRERSGVVMHAFNRSTKLVHSRLVGAMPKKDMPKNKNTVEKN